jgi:streptomycin 3"-adenylyltransferase
MTGLTCVDTAQLQVIAWGMQRALGAVAIGAHLHGSTGLQRRLPRSDLDVLVVTKSRLNAAQRAEVTTFLLDVSGQRARRGPAGRPVEVTIVAHTEVKPWRYPPRCELQYGEWLRDEITCGSRLDSFVSPDLAVVLTEVLACEVRLFGPATYSIRFLGTT